MSQVQAKFVLKGAREGEDFTPKNMPNINFIKGEFAAILSSSELPNLERVLLTYGAELQSLGGKPRGSALAPDDEAPVTAETTEEQEAPSDEAPKEDDSDVQQVPEPVAEEAAPKRRRRSKAKTGDKGLRASDADGEGADDGADKNNLI